MHFTRLRGTFSNLTLSLGGSQPVPHVPETKFLGLVFDSKLSWVPHLRSARVKCMRSLELLKCLSRLSWGADRTTLLRVYRAITRSQLDYGCQVYSSATRSSLQMLDTIHHQGLRSSIGAFRTSPVASLYAEAGEPSLWDRRDKLSLQLYARLLGMPNTPACDVVCDRSLDHHYTTHPRLHTPFGYRVRLLFESLRLPDLTVMSSTSYTVPPYKLRLNGLCPGIMSTSKSDTPPALMRTIFVGHTTIHGSNVPIYTDGSKMEEGVGCSVVFPDRTVSRTLPKAASIYTAELFAIYFLLFYLFRYDDQQYIVYSDSRSALHSICDAFNLHPVVVQIHCWLDLLRERGRSVRFCWVPSHVGVRGNELADEAAGAAAMSRGPVTPRPLPYRDYYPFMHSFLRDRWLREWRNIGPNKLRAIKDNVQVWRTSHRSVRREEVLLARIRIGHSRLTHKNLLDGDPPPYCEECLVPLTIEHIITECPNYADERRTHLGATGILEPLDLRVVLRDEERAVRAVLGFLSAVGLQLSL